MKLIDLLIGETSYRFERDINGDIWIYDDAHRLDAVIEKRGEWIEYHVFDVGDSANNLAVIDVAALRQLETIANKIAEDLEE